MQLTSLPCFALPLVLTGIVAPELTGVTIEPGTKVTKTYSSTLNLELVDVGVTLNGEEQEIPEDERPEVTISDEEELIFEDVYVAVADGQPTELLRTFTTLRDTSTQTQPGPDGEEEEKVEDGESALEGESVRFLWDDDTEEFVASFTEDEDQDESLLEDLDADADFRYLLSDEAMDVGSTWDVDVVAFDRISSPSGDLHIDSPDGEDGDDEEFAEAFRDGLDGTFTGTYKSLEDGIATIVYEGEITTSFEVDGPEGPEGSEGSVAFEFTFEVSGTLLWNMETGVASEFQLEGDVEMLINNEMTFGENEFAQSQHFTGQLESAAIFE